MVWVVLVVVIWIAFPRETAPGAATTTIEINAWPAGTSVPPCTNISSVPVGSNAAHAVYWAGVPPAGFVRNSELLEVSADPTSVASDGAKSGRLLSSEIRVNWSKHAAT